MKCVFLFRIKEIEGGRKVFGLISDKVESSLKFRVGFMVLYGRYAFISCVCSIVFFVFRFVVLSLDVRVFC